VLKGLLEVDESYVGGVAEGIRGRGAAGKTPGAVALELNETGKPGRMAMSTLAKVDGHSLRKFAVQSIEKGSTLRTDGWGSYRRVAKAGYQHKATVTGSGK